MGGDRRAEDQLVPSTVSIGDVLTAAHFARGRRACWAPHLAAEFDADYMVDLRRRLIAEEQAGNRILPRPERVFEALDETTPEEVKIVIIGQDPHPGPDQAHGLAFSIELGSRPTSLQKIFAEVNRSMAAGSRRLGQGADGPACLTPWARDGVLLLNTVLTVTEGRAGKHIGWGWETFTKRVVETVISQCQHVVFMLWGRKAQEMFDSIEPDAHLVLCSRHPAIGLQGRHFARANSYLAHHDRAPVDWLDVCRRPPPEEQDRTRPLGAADAADEARWDRQLAASPALLEQLALEAAGPTEELDLALAA